MYLILCKTSISLMAKKIHPNSLANLSGRPKAYLNEDKRRRSLTVTDTGWEGAQPIIRQAGCASVSEFIEKLGRGQIDFKLLESA